MGKNSEAFNWLVFTPALILTCLGLITILSIDPQLFIRQLIFAGIGLILCVAVYKIDFQIFPYFRSYFYVFSIIFLLLSFLGTEVRGATRWFEVAGVRIQPSELVKPLLIFAFAGFLTQFRPGRLKYIGLNLAAFLPAFFLVFKQPDLGNSIVYFVFWFSMLILSEASLPFLILLIIFFTTVLPLGYGFLKDYQKARLISYLNPNLDPKGAGYNAIQAMIAIGSGLLFGRGFGRGTQSQLMFLPERHTDFIFASFSEEFGFAGGLVLLFIYFWLLWQILKIAKNSGEDGFMLLVIGGICIQLLSQVLVNVGMNLGIVPITGITLPFVSSGGSSLIASWVTIGIVLSASKSQRA